VGPNASQLEITTGHRRRYDSRMTTHADPEAALNALGLALPAAAKPVAAYIPTKQVGNLLYVSGQIPVRDGQMIARGSMPTQVTEAVALDCAVQCTLNGLAAVKAAVGSLSKIKQVVRVGVFVCSEPGFDQQPKIANGCSELLVKVFGEAGRHCRAAVGSVALPLGAPVEIEFLFELHG
jgi:enamine deaminase RidA (YjgF/YER057c/UK114 family)